MPKVQASRFLITLRGTFYLNLLFPITKLKPFTGENFCVKSATNLLVQSPVKNKSLGCFWRHFSHSSRRFISFAFSGGSKTQARF